MQSDTPRLAALHGHSLHRGLRNPMRCSHLALARQGRFVRSQRPDDDHGVGWQAACLTPSDRGTGRIDSYDLGLLGSHGGQARDLQRGYAHLRRGLVLKGRVLNLLAEQEW